MFKKIFAAVFAVAAVMLMQTSVFADSTKIKDVNFEADFGIEMQPQNGAAIPTPDFRITSTDPEAAKEAVCIDETKPLGWYCNGEPCNSGDTFEYGNTYVLNMTVAIKPTYTSNYYFYYQNGYVSGNTHLLNNGTVYATTQDAKTLVLCKDYFVPATENDPPKISNTTTDFEVVTGDDFSFKLNAYDYYSTEWSIVGTLPDNLSLSGNELSGYFSNPGNYSITVKATNKNGSDTKTFNIAVEDDSSYLKRIYLEGVYMEPVLGAKINKYGLKIVSTYPEGAINDLDLVYDKWLVAKNEPALAAQAIEYIDATSSYFQDRTYKYMIKIKNSASDKWNLGKAQIYINGVPIKDLGKSGSTTKYSSSTNPDDCGVYGNIYFNKSEQGIVFDEETGTLILVGNVKKGQINSFRADTRVKHIAADETAVLPADCSSLFAGFSAVEDIDLSAIESNTITDISNMFYNCGSLVVVDISGIDLTAIDNADMVFYGDAKLQTVYVDADAGDLSHAKSKSSVLYGCTSVKGGMGTTYKANIDSWALAHVDGGTSDPGYFTAFTEGLMYDSNTGILYISCEFDKDTISDYKTVAKKIICKEGAKVSDARQLFSGFTNVNSIDLSDAKIGADKLNSMFASCTNLETVKFPSNYTAEKVTQMTTMFSGCFKLKNVNFSNFDTSKVTVMRNMFKDCSSLETLDLGNFNISSTVSTGTDNMFTGCTALKTLTIGDFSINKYMQLPNADIHWINKNERTKIVSGDGTFAVITNSGINTYYRAYMQGDIDKNNILEGKDAALVLKYLNGTAELEDSDQQRMYVNDDDFIDILDVIALLKSKTA